MSKIRVTKYNDFKLINLDFSGLKTTKDIQAVIDESTTHIRNSPPKSVLTLTNISGMHFNSDIKDIFSEFAKGNSLYVKAAAIFGVSGLHKIIINGINKFTGRKLKAFEDQISAKSWLTSQC